jgi:hypothetical protein
MGTYLVLLMIGGRPIRFLLILGLRWFSLTLVHGMISGEKCNSTFNGSILDVGRVFQQTSNDAFIVLNWPLMFAMINNNPPRTPIIPLGKASGIPQANYAYSTSAIDPEGDQVQYLLDWGDGTTSIIGP